MFSVWDENYEISGAEEFMLEWANIPQYQWLEADLTPDECDEPAFDRLLRIRNELPLFFNLHPNLLLCGHNLGCGKTEWALKLMLTHIENNKSRFNGIDEKLIDKGLLNIGVFCQTVPFLVEMKQFGNNSDSQKLYNKLSTTELAVFDDVSAVPMSNYDYNILYALVEKRLFAGLPCIFTTNATSQKELESTVGPRLAERIWKTSLVIELKGRGYRGV